MKRIVLLIMMSTIFILSACGNNAPNIETNMSETIAPFDFTTQDGDQLGLDDLKGQWWVADFIFTNCTTVCLPMTSNMAILQKKINEAELENVQLISFSVDPDYDTQEVLKDYAEQYDADLSNWSFLTGYEFETVKELSIKSFRALLQEAPKGDDQVIHGTQFFLVNPDGELIKYYSGIEADSIDQIFEDLKEVQQ